MWEIMLCFCSECWSSQHLKNLDLNLLYLHISHYSILCFLTTSQHRVCAVKWIENIDTIFSSEDKYSQNRLQSRHTALCNSHWASISRWCPEKFSGDKVTDLTILCIWVFVIILLPGKADSSLFLYSLHGFSFLFFLWDNFYFSEVLVIFLTSLGMTSSISSLSGQTPCYTSLLTACCHNYNLILFCLVIWSVSVSHDGSFLLNVWSMYITSLAPPGILLEKRNIWSCPYTINLLFNNDPVNSYAYSVLRSGTLDSKLHEAVVYQKQTPGAEPRTRNIFIKPNSFIINIYGNVPEACGLIAKLKKK